MKKIYTLIAILAFGLPATAQQMLIDRQGGENDIISLDNLEKITFNGTTVNIEQTNGTKSCAAMGDINRIYFGDFTSIEDVKPQERELVTYITRDEITINCAAETMVTIYDVIGSQVLCVRLKADCGKVSIANLPQGIYIVKAGNQTAKIIKR